MITASGIRKAYGPLQVLRGVDISIASAEVVSIVGASGAGKSTLLHILGTLDSTDSGSISIAGTDVSGLKGSALAKFRNRHLGFVFQSHHLLPEFTALENVMLPALIGHVPKAQAEKKGLQLLEQLGLSGRATHRPSELSGGEQQRVAVARALINDPSVVFADEPSGNLDSSAARSLHKLFFSVREKQKVTFVIVTHNRELAEMADRTLTMKDGILL
jgi:lipoprotein-releasing system ATP-binding protein